MCQTRSVSCFHADLFSSCETSFPELIQLSPEPRFYHRITTTQTLSRLCHYLSHMTLHTSLISEAISYSLPTSFLSFTRWVRSHSVILSDIVGEAIWSLWGGLIQHTPWHDPHLPYARSISASLRETKEHVTAPWNAWSSHRLSFSVADFSFGCTKQRAFPWSVCSRNLLASTKSRIAEDNHTLRHEIRYSGKK
jgi:hypothetical protein